jgi:hypothetical protein
MYGKCGLTDNAQNKPYHLEGEWQHSGASPSPGTLLSKQYVVVKNEKVVRKVNSRDQK